MLRRLPMALAQVKAGNTSENLLNEIRQYIYSFRRGKEVTKKYITTSMNYKFNKFNEYCIYEFCK